MRLKRNPDGTYEVPVRDRRMPDGQRREKAVVSAILVCTLLLVVFGALLLILPSYRVGRIEVRGNNITSAEAIIAASGVRIGDETFSIDKEEVISRIYDSPSCAAIRSVSVRRAFRKVTIVVEDGELTLAASYGPYRFTLDRDLRVLEISEDPDAFSDCVQVYLPWAAGLCEGEILQFSDTGLDRGYITELLGALDSSGEWNRISAIDVSRRFSVSVERGGHVRIVLGSASDFEKKRALADEALAEMDPGEEKYVIVDVTDPAKITCRSVPREEFLSSRGT